MLIPAGVYGIIHVAMGLQSGESQFINDKMTDRNKTWEQLINIM